jgi:hypothetical protein
LRSQWERGTVTHFEPVVQGVRQPGAVGGWTSLLASPPQAGHIGVWDRRGADAGRGPRLTDAGGGNGPSRPRGEAEQPPPTLQPQQQRGPGLPTWNAARVLTGEAAALIVGSDSACLDSSAIGSHLAPEQGIGKPHFSVAPLVVAAVSAFCFLKKILAGRGIILLTHPLISVSIMFGLALDPNCRVVARDGHRNLRVGVGSSECGGGGDVGESLTCQRLSI